MAICEPSGRFLTTEDTEFTEKNHSKIFTTKVRPAGGVLISICVTSSRETVFLCLGFSFVSFVVKDF
jgi:hypothetical protein